MPQALQPRAEQLSFCRVVGSVTLLLLSARWETAPALNSPFEGVSPLLEERVPVLLGSELVVVARKKLCSSRTTTTSTHAAAAGETVLLAWRRKLYSLTSRRCSIPKTTKGAQSWVEV